VAVTWIIDCHWGVWGAGCAEVNLSKYGGGVPLFLVYRKDMPVLTVNLASNGERGFEFIDTNLRPRTAGRRTREGAVGCPQQTFSCAGSSPKYTLCNLPCRVFGRWSLHRGFVHATILPSGLLCVFAVDVFGGRLFCRLARQPAAPAVRRQRAIGLCCSCHWPQAAASDHRNPRPGGRGGGGSIGTRQHFSFSLSLGHSFMRMICAP
jgi:hypothetical protein